MLLQFVFLAILEDAIVSIGPWIQVVTSISLLQHGVHSVLSCLYRQGRRKPMLRRCRDHSRWSGCSEDQKDGHFSESIPFCLECDGSPMRSGWKGICCGSYSVWPLVLFLSPNHTSDSWHSKFEFTVEIPQSTLVSSISQRISCSHILLFNLVKISSPGPAMACYGLLGLLGCLAWPRCRHPKSWWLRQGFGTDVNWLLVLAPVRPCPFLSDGFWTGTPQTQPGHQVIRRPCSIEAVFLYNCQREIKRSYAAKSGVRNSFSAGTDWRGFAPAKESTGCTHVSWLCDDLWGWLGDYIIL